MIGITRPNLIRNMELNREKALELLHQYVKNEKMISMSCFRSSTRGMHISSAGTLKNGPWPDWLHDLDVEITGADPTVHGTRTEALLKDYSVTLIYWMPYGCTTNVLREGEEHRIPACPGCRRDHHGGDFCHYLRVSDKKLAGVKPKSVVKRMKEKCSPLR